MIELFANIWNLLLMIIGFGLVIVVHELGHFLAAKWAGIRVHAFAVGFGSAICSYRKGLGFRRGSTEPEYFEKANALTGATGERLLRAEVPGVSATEYRLNWFPFGGYVKMLGQDDLSADKVVVSPDSYSAKPVWKRMIVISAGVVMNVVLAAVLFMVVFLAGMKAVAPVVGDVAPNFPAAEAGFASGDLVLAIDGSTAEEFSDIMIAGGLGRRDQEHTFKVQRFDTAEPIEIEVAPKIGQEGLLQFGLGQALGAHIPSPKRRADREEVVRRIEQAGLAGVEPGMTIVAVNDRPNEPVTTAAGDSVRLFEPVRVAAEQSGGSPIEITFRSAAGDERTVSVAPSPELQVATTIVNEEVWPFRHLFGLVPVLQVRTVTDVAAEQGLRAGDVFARIDSVSWPSLPAGVRAIKANAGKAIEAEVIRDGKRVPLTLRVNAQGMIGFGTGEAIDRPYLADLPDVEPLSGETGGEEAGELSGFAAQRMSWRPGAGVQLLEMNGAPIGSLLELRAALQSFYRQYGVDESAPPITLTFGLLPSDGIEPSPSEPVELAPTSREIEALLALSWNADVISLPFEAAMVELKGDNPLDAMLMGLRRTHRTMLMTYITFKRLFEGTVKVEHLKGPVGITHLGTQFASQGFIYLLFFLALISANLAVINFLPIPVVDGGQFVFLLIEAITRRPVSIMVQNIATFAGLFLIAAVFLVVTFNDIVALFG